MSSSTVTVVLAPATAGPSTRAGPSGRAAIVLQKPKTIAAIQPAQNDLETERTRRKEELTAALRVVAKQNIDHFTVCRTLFLWAFRCHPLTSRGAERTRFVP